MPTVNRRRVLLLCACLLAAVAAGRDTEKSDVPLRQLLRVADHIFAGRVDGVEAKDVPNPAHTADPDMWVNTHWRLNVTVDTVHKSAAHSRYYGKHEEHLRFNETLQVGDKVHVFMWRVKRRPPEVKVQPVHAGVTSALPVAGDGETYTFFCRYLHHDRGMYGQSWPREEELPDGRPVYNALTPNGIWVGGLPSSDEGEL